MRNIPGFVSCRRYWLYRPFNLNNSDWIQSYAFYQSTPDTAHPIILFRAIYPLVVLLILLHAQSGLAETIYRSTDSHGRTLYSDIPTPAAKPLQPATPPARSKYQVTRVIDGDTIVLENNKRVRLLGINAPETGNRYHPGEPGGADAKSGCEGNYRGAAYIWNMTGKHMITIKNAGSLVSSGWRTYQSFPGGEGIGHSQPDPAQPAPCQYAHQGTTTGRNQETRNLVNATLSTAPADQIDREAVRLAALPGKGQSTQTKPPIQPAHYQ